MGLKEKNSRGEPVAGPKLTILGQFGGAHES